MDDIAKIVARLEEPMRNAILVLYGYHDQHTLRILERRGMYKHGQLTRLGLAVRDYLRSKNDG